LAPLLHLWSSRYSDSAYSDDQNPPPMTFAASGYDEVEAKQQR
jgi:hypothetical protein